MSAFDPEKVNLWKDGELSLLCHGIAERLEFELPEGVSVDPDQIENAITSFLQDFIPEEEKT